MSVFYVARAHSALVIPHIFVVGGGWGCIDEREDSVRQVTDNMSDSLKRAPVLGDRSKCQRTANEPGRLINCII